MNARDDEKTREEALHRLLARSLRQSLKAGGADCPAPETLAAYFDRSLTSSEASHWESHFFTCARCQQVLAALATSELAPAAVDETHQVAAFGTKAAAPAAQPPRDVHALRRYLRWNWLVPAAAAAAALLLWIAIRPSPRTSVEVARENQTTAPAAEIAPQAPGQATKEFAQNLPPVPAPAIKRKAEVAVPSPGTGNKTGREHYARAAPSQLHEATKTLTADAARAPSAEREALGKLTPPVASREKAEADEERKAQRKEAVSAAAAPVRGEAAAESAAPPQAAAKTAGAKQVQAQSGLAASGATAQISQAKPRAMASDRVAYRSTLVVIASPSRSVLWRVGPGGSIERSRDAGRTWEAQASTATADLLAGSAPSETVCWVVGRAGTILRTTDGEHWEKVPSPAALDWNWIKAQDALHANVSAGTGIVYVTHDGGQTWPSIVP
jgi:hypothetical protein